MVSGEGIDAKLQNYAAASMKLDAKDAIILELKVNSTPEEATEQIKVKNYALRFKGKLGKSPKYTLLWELVM